MKNKTNRRLLPWLLSTALALLPLTVAAQSYRTYGTPMRGMQPIVVQPTDDLPPDATYGEKIGYKAASGLTNLFTSWLEIPKNVINTTNQTNLAFGLTGGVFKGVVNTAGRIMVGVVDFLTFYIPTKPIPHPAFVWHDFDIDTTYGPVFRLRDSYVAEIQEPVPAQPDYVPPPPPPSHELDSAAQRLEDASRETDQRIDDMFKDYMTK